MDVTSLKLNFAMANWLIKRSYPNPYKQDKCVNDVISAGKAQKITSDLLNSDIKKCNTIINQFLAIADTMKDSFSLGIKDFFVTVFLSHIITSQHQFYLPETCSNH